ncbi:uncharacterized protein BO97DRAFT_50340 [Aspergillus homomorphus CBS 101889]|uniref:Uncharacterized protein n=1 Tax=Aspergillus homomorphus (strain CBS 101889) TaxID=1450537 RepID=A0A395HZU1_ASPHC|nr:hypothetical protein BO97DRAFT_50340 [Aspergillus homomorphus CBS 101889]RAL13005.1 hypothetical protein BO97DRAFT_50340 [Aspergillus homomorphus CBS 101889]
MKPPNFNCLSTHSSLSVIPLRNSFWRHIKLYHSGFFLSLIDLFEVVFVFIFPSPTQGNDAVGGWTATVGRPGNSGKSIAMTRVLIVVIPALLRTDESYYMEAKSPSRITNVIDHTAKMSCLTFSPPSSTPPCKLCGTWPHAWVGDTDRSGIGIIGKAGQKSLGPRPHTIKVSTGAEGKEEPTKIEQGTGSHPEQELHTSERRKPGLSSTLGPCNVAPSTHGQQHFSQFIPRIAGAQ